MKERPKIEIKGLIPTFRASSLDAVMFLDGNPLEFGGIALELEREQRRFLVIKAPNGEQNAVSVAEYHTASYGRETGTTMASYSPLNDEALRNLARDTIQAHSTNHIEVHFLD